VVNAASNVLGSPLPVADLVRLAHDAGALVLVDAAQSAGHTTLTYGDDGVDMVAFTGHKALLAPTGTGGLWVREGLEVAPLLTGGTGGDSSRRAMPAEMPDSLEAGTVNSAGIAGLLAGCTYLLDHGIEAIHAREMALKATLFEALEATPGVRVVSPPAPDGVPIVTVTVDGMDPSMAAERLNREFGVMVRHGLHCAPEAHGVLGTKDAGAVRLSLGWASTEEDVARAVEGLSAIAHTSHSV
jgi:selenocysteine lyase/cysteine desulfurase